MSLKNFFWIAIAAAFSLLALVVVQGAWHGKAYDELVVEGVITSLAGFVTVAAYMFATNIDKGVSQASDLKSQNDQLIKQYKEEKILLEEERNKQRIENDKEKIVTMEILNTVLQLTPSLQEYKNIIDEDIKVLAAKSMGLMSKSWLTTLNSKSGEKSGLKWWADIQETYFLEEAFDIYQGEVVTNARNYLLFILASLNSLLEDSDNNKIHYFASSYVPPLHYFNFPFVSEVEGTNHYDIYYSHKEINYFTVAIESLLRDEAISKRLNIERCLVTVADNEDYNIMRQSCMKLGWAPPHKDIIVSNMKKNFNKYVANIILLNDIPHENDGNKKLYKLLTNNICEDSFGILNQDYGSHEWLDGCQFIPMCRDSEELKKWILPNGKTKRTIFESGFDYFKSQVITNKYSVSDIIEELCKKHPGISLDLQKKWFLIDKMISKLADSQNINNPLLFFEYYHWLEASIAQLSEPYNVCKRNLENATNLLKNIICLWQYNWFDGKEDNIMTLRDYWKTKCHSKNGEMYCNFSVLNTQANKFTTLWPNFALFGIENQTGVTWKFGICSKTDKNWSTTHIKLLDSSSKGGMKVEFEQYEDLMKSMKKNQIIIN